MALLDSEYPVLEVPQRKATLAEVGLDDDPIPLVQQDPLKMTATILALLPDQVVVETQKELVKVLAQALLQEPQQLQALLQEGLQEGLQLQADELQAGELQADEQLQVAHQLAYCRHQYHVVRATA